MTSLTTINQKLLTTCLVSNMKPSEKCKQAGLKSLAELSEISGESVQTLNNWWKRKPFAFDAALERALDEKGIITPIAIGAAAVVADFVRRGITPDRVEAVEQGLLLMWQIRQSYICDLRYGAESVEPVPGEWSYQGGAYINTYSPQEMADDMARRAGKLPT